MKIILLTLLAVESVTGDAVKAFDRAFRHEFIQKMEEARGKKHHQAKVNRKLLKAAKPLRVEPEFMKHRLLDENNNNNAGNDNEFAVDLTEYALKYVGCSNIHVFSDELVQNGNTDSIMGMDRFVVLRLCPKEECSNYYEYGCQSGYGDYLLEMESYLQIMSENYFNQYIEYCETCNSCMHPNAANGNDDNNNNGYYGWNDYKMDDDGNANCRYEDVCTNYWSACKDYNSEAYQLEDYFECSQFNMGNNIAYLGPHCGDDGKTIGIGVYADGYCNEYVKDLKEVSSYLDIDMSDSSDYLKPFTSENCISCLASEGYNLDDNADEDYAISDLCYAIYDESAKCNKYMGNDGNINSDVQEENEETVCTFIHNIVTGTYDEYGEIYLGGSGLKTYIKYVSKFTPFQQWTLVISILLVLGLTSYSIYLHRLVTTNRFVWTTRRGYSNDPNSDPSKFGRDHSGIMSGRSFDKGYLA